MKRLESWVVGLHDASDPLNDKIARRSTDMLFNKLPQVVNTISIIPLIVSMAFVGKVSLQWLLIWLSMALSVSVFRYVLAMKYLRLEDTHQAHYFWMNCFVASSLFSGVIWGAAGIWLFDTFTGAHTVLLYGAIIGLSAGCVVIASYTIRGYFAFTAPAMGMSAFYLLAQHALESVALGGMMVILFLIITKAALNQQQESREAMRLLFENIDLIEQLKQQKAIAEKADADKSRFLAAASHDLRQPLHAMQLYLSSVNPKMGLLRQPEVWLGLQRSMSSLQGLFNSLLDLSRLDAGMLHPNWREFSLKALVEGFIGEYVAQAYQKGLQFTIPEHDALVRSDPVLLETVIRNLVSNAIRYTETGTVELLWRNVDVGIDSAKVLLAVKDTGMGIPVDYQQEIFNEYFQIDNPERDKNKGLGLGLAIVRRLAKLLECEISLTSTVGEGSSFYMTIPLGHAAESLHLERSEKQVVNEFAGNVVWVIDDEVLVREGMRHLLVKWGCQVHTFEGYAEALSSWQQSQQMPNMLIADYRLRNHENGAQVIRQLMQSFRVTLPCLIVTGDTSPERLREAQSYGFPLMHKPVNEIRLRVFMRQSLLSNSS